MSNLPTWAAERLEGRSVGRGAARVIETLDLQPQLASYASTAQMAERAGVNAATVVRAAQALGFSGWSELRGEVRSRYLASLSAVQVLGEHSTSTVGRTRDAVRQDLSSLEALATTIDPEQIVSMAHSIAGAGKTLVIGSGSFVAPGLQLAHVAQTMGLDVRLCRDAGTVLFNEVCLLTADDVLVVFSFWWNARSVLAATRVAAESGATILLVTDRRSTPFTELAQAVVTVVSEGVSTFPSLTAATTVVHCLLAEIAEVNQPEVRRALSRAEAIWRSNDMFTDAPRSDQ